MTAAGASVKSLLPAVAKEAPEEIRSAAAIPICLDAAGLQARLATAS